jgi:hypothetical protein
MTRILMIALIGLTVTGCSRLGIGQGRSSQPSFDGQWFRASAKAARSDRQNFVVTVRQVSKSPRGAVEAAKYQATSHCLRFFGTSDFVWALPEIGEDGDATQLPVENDTLTVSGTCNDI